MELAGITTAELTRRLAESGPPVTISYVARICKGERKLKRNPVMIRRIAEAIGVRRDWIEVERPREAA